MSTVVITIETDGAAFYDDSTGQEHPKARACEVARILRCMANQFEDFCGANDPRDINGKVVGTVEVKGGE